MTKPAPSLNNRVVALAYDGLCAFEFGIAAEVFGLARPEMGLDWYSFVVCAEHPGRLTTNAGLSVVVDSGLEALDLAGTIIIPGWPSDNGPPSDKLRAALVAAHHRGARFVTICSGAFLLAEIGVLNGLRATTHWRYAESLQAMYPAVRVDAETLYSDEGTIMTSAGSAAGIDLLLHVVRKDFGPNAANIVARRMVVAAHRSGGQSQFIERAVSVQPQSPVARALDVIRADLSRAWTVETMAALTVMSARTFVRRFHEAIGLSPGAWLVAQRLVYARDLLETTQLSIDKIADITGLGTSDNMRLHFARDIGVPPTVYRRQFGRV